MTHRITLATLSLVFAFTGLFSFLMPAPTASAAIAEGCSGSFLGIPQWFKYLDVAKVGDPGSEICQVVGPCVYRTGDNQGNPAPTSECVNGSTRLNVPVVVQRVAIAILDILLRVAGIVAFAFLVFSGFKFVLSEGDANKAKDARGAAINAAIGLGIAIVATSVVAFIGRSVSS